ncbi:helix-turn-helix domain-containing protein, partial [Salmonella enterica subsp. enterica serovar Cerro]|nr:helix-turn-helix domain-containing protein [Salmonella enterica subsp. enterica serovar Cerro]
MKTFADRLNAAMSASGLSQAQLAEKVGISQPAIQKMSSGKMLSQDKRIEALAEDFSDKHHALFLGRGDQYPIALEGALKLKE